jgi:aspartate kinase
VVPDARRIGTMSYEETQELAESGAKVLNAQAVEFAKEKGIAIYARATKSPLPGADPSADGTVVRRDTVRQPGSVVGVASEHDVLLLSAGATHGTGVSGASDLFSMLDELGVVGKQLNYGGEALTMVISRENLHEEGKVRAELARRFDGRARLIDGLGAVSVVGAGINATFGNLRRGLNALSAGGIVPRHIATSSFRISWMIDRARLDDAVRLLHQTFIAS